MKILIADDEIFSRRLLSETLRSLGYEVIEAEDGRRAWEAYRLEPTPIVICDWIMPEIDGLQLSRLIRAEAALRYTYIIMVTIMEGKGSFMEAMQAGVDDFITKPFDNDQLAARLRVAERILNLRDENGRLARLIPICSHCKKVRDDDSFWEEVETFVSRHARAQLSHAICPTCYDQIIRPGLEAFRLPGVTPRAEARWLNSPASEVRPAQSSLLDATTPASFERKQSSMELTGERTERSTLKILHLEDNPADAELAGSMLADEGFVCEVTRVETRTEFLANLNRGGWDLVLADFNLPSFDGLSALTLAQQVRPEVPFIFVSGELGEETAIDSLTQGATDYVLKHRISRLVPAVRRALREVAERTERRQAEMALRESEEKFRTLVQSAPQAFVLVGKDGRIMYVNPQTEAMFGYSDGELVGQPIEILVPSRIRAAHLKHRFNYMSAPHTRLMGRGLELFGQRKDGSEFPVEIGLNYIETKDGFYTMTLISDITDRKKLEGQVLRSQKMESIGQLAGGVAHDFNNLLTVINGYSELVLHQLSEQDPRRKLVEEVKKAGDRAASLTRQLLIFSRKQKLEPKVLDMNNVIADMEKMLRRLIGEDIEFVTTLDPTLGRIKNDPAQIEQVIMNLVVNARDAMPSGGRLVIETANVTLDQTYAEQQVGVRPGRYILLMVSDTGCGMDAETQARIFEPFFTTKAEGKGTGLGLATVYGIVQEGQGHVAVYSEVGRGTTFKVYFPEVREAVGPVESKPSSVEFPGGSETILLVEDDPMVRQLAEQILLSVGYKVLLAENGAEALQLAEQYEGTIHLMISDFVMPGMNGHELAEQMKLIRQETKIVYMSGYTEKAMGNSNVVIPTKQMLHKPFTVESLTQKVREGLDGSHH